MRPVPQSNVQPEARENRVGLNYFSGKPLARAIDPNNGVLWASGFTITVDDIQMRGVEAFTVGILFDVLGITRGGFGAAAHAQERRSGEIRTLASFFGQWIIARNSFVTLPSVFVTSLNIVRARHAEQRRGHVDVVRIVIENRLPVFSGGRERAVGEVNSRPAHVLGRANLRGKFSIGGAIGSIIDTYGVQRRISCALSISQGDQGKDQAETEKVSQM